MSFFFEAATLTHTGKVRKVNEDSVLSEPNRGIWIVADGMGGHSDGGVASSMITESVREMVAQNEPKSQLRSRLLHVNQELLKRSNGEAANIVGSTVAALMTDDRNYTCLWAGDSRCYLVRGGQISQVSHDHTEVQELLSSGIISPEEAQSWHRKNVITRAVGATSRLELDQAQGPLNEGDCFVLCSDGLTGHVSDGEILSSVTWADPSHACEKLVELALDRGGKDNVSVIVINVRLAGKTVIVRQDKG